jgi:hypothetical protein
MTWYQAIPFIVAATIATFATPAHAQSVNDIQCVLASNATGKVAKEPNIKRVAEATLHFYLGRIDGKYNEAQLAAAFTSQLSSLAGTNVGSIMQNCYQYAQQRFKLVQGVGEQLSRTRK